MIMFFFFIKVFKSYEFYLKISNQSPQFFELANSLDFSITVRVQTQECNPY